MRSVWAGSVKLGESSIPVKAYGATEERGIGLHQVHETDGGRVRHRRVCEVDGEEVDYADVAKGYPLAGGEMVVLTDEDFAKLPLPTSRAIEIQAFVPLAEIDPIYLAKSYHLEPEAAGAKSYVLLSEALQQSGRVAIVKVALRQRESLGVLRVRDQVIVLETMLWPDEVRTPDFPFLHQDIDVDLLELSEAVSLIEELSERFVPSRYSDRYVAALRELVRAKIDGDEVVQPNAAAQQAGAADLLSALRSTLRDRHDVSEAPEEAVGRAREAARKARSSTTSATRAARGSRTPSQRG